MKSSNNLYNNKIFKFFDYVFRLVLINILIVVPSFLFIYLSSIIFGTDSYWMLLGLIPAVLYFYPAICAGVDLVRKYELKITNTVFKEFFKSFQKFYLKGLIETLFIVLIVVLFYNSIMYFYNDFFVKDGSMLSFAGFILASAFAISVLCIIVHLPLVMTYFEGCRIIDDVKLAGLMAFKDLPITLAVVIVSIVFDVISFGLENSYLLLIIGSVSFPIYLLVKLTFKKYLIPYAKKIKRDENEKNNI